jgi:hypothetical protein
MTTKVAIAMSVFVLAACGGTPSESEEAKTTSENEALVSRTMVSFDEQGHATSKVETITRAQQLAEIEERQRMVDAMNHPQHGIQKTSSAMTTQDNSCAGSSLWMFDGENLTGNEICFSGQGWANLGDYADGAFVCSGWYCFRPTWAKHARSLWAGVDTGYLYPCSGFGAYERRDVLSVPEQESITLYLTPYTCPLK